MSPSKKLERMGFQEQRRASTIHVQILTLIEKIFGRTLSVNDLVGTHRIKCLEASREQEIYRGHISLDSLRDTPFTRVDFCVTHRWNKKAREKSWIQPPTSTMIMLGWVGARQHAYTTLSTDFGVRLFKGVGMGPVEDAGLQPKNWIQPSLWGGKPPSMLAEDRHIPALLNGDERPFAVRSFGNTLLSYNW